LFADPLLDRLLHTLEKLPGWQARARTGALEHGRRLASSERVFIGQGSPFRPAVLEQVLDVPVKLLGIVVHRPLLC
jgi:hypothetical protein